MAGSPAPGVKRATSTPLLSTQILCAGTPLRGGDLRRVGADRHDGIGVRQAGQDEAQLAGTGLAVGQLLAMEIEDHLDRGLQSPEKPRHPVTDVHRVYADDLDLLLAHDAEKF